MQTYIESIIVLVLVQIAAVSGVVAGEKAPESSTRPSEVEALPQPGSERKPTEPAGTFTPTEKIKADSSVSFPVDI